MALEHPVVRKTFWIRDSSMSSPIAEPTEIPCRVLFLYNNSSDIPVVVTIESSVDGGVADYWIAIPFADCGVGIVTEKTIQPHGLAVIMFRPPERYFRVVLSVTIPEGVRCEMHYFSDHDSYDAEAEER